MELNIGLENISCDCSCKLQIGRSFMDTPQLYKDNIHKYGDILYVQMYVTYKRIYRRN